MNKIYTISNILSISRAVLAIPLFFAFYFDKTIWVLILTGIAIITDVLDGYLARKLNQVTEYGKIFDPLADKVFVSVAVIMYIFKNLIPLWFAISIFTRDILILIGGLYAKKKLKYVIPSDYLGKFSVILLTITLILSLFKLGNITNIFIYLTTLMLIISFFNYLYRMLKMVGSKK